MDRNDYRSLDSCFQKTGVSLNNFDKRVINYRQIEQVVTEFRASYRNTFNFKQISAILASVRERMDMETYHREGNKLESFYSYHGSRHLHKDCCKLSEKEMSHLPSRNIIRKCNYKLENDNEGLGQWLAYQIGL
jgi:hypothetical protein